MAAITQQQEFAFHILITNNNPLKFTNQFKLATQQQPSILYSAVKFMWQIRNSIISKFKLPFPISQFNLAPDNNIFTTNEIQYLSQLQNQLDTINNSTQLMVIQQKKLALVNILKHCKRFYKYRELEVITPACEALYLQFTAGWTSYEPLRTKKSFTLYRKTTDLTTLHQFLGVMALNRCYQVPNATNTGVEELDITAEASLFRPFIALFSPISQIMVMSFYYFPFPRRPDWKPHWRADYQKKKDGDDSKLQPYLKEKVTDGELKNIYKRRLSFSSWHTQFAVELLPVVLDTRNITIMET